MKKTLKLTVIAALMAMGVTQINAATDKTIWVQPLNYTLTAYVDSAAKPTRLTTKDVITHLNGLTPSGASNVLAFTVGSSHLLIRLDTTTSNRTVIVRDSKTKVDTDVSEFFSFNDLTSINGTPVTTSSATVATNFRISSHQLNEFDFEGDGLSFDLAGFTVETKRSLIGGAGTVTQSATADVLGSGTVSTGDPAVIHGTITSGGGRLEAPAVP